MNHDPPDVVGFGALNVDYIASASSMSARLAEQVSESTARFEWNREGPVDEETVVSAMRQLGVASLSSSLGGSAWLTVFALAQMRVGIRLGYVGVVGRVEAPGLSFTGQMRELHIDHRWVARRVTRPCGICLSYIDDTDRVMLTYPGANFEVADHIRKNFDGISRYLSAARYVHVTSFLDDETPDELLRVLTAAKELNPRLRISFDPGFDWAAHPTPAIEGILAQTNLLFLNFREFKAVGRYTYGEPDESVAGKVLARCAPGCTVFVTKRYDSVEVFQAQQGAVSAHRHRLARPLSAIDLEDATGAGDVFAAAVLASLTSPQLQVELGAYLGLSLARHRMKQHPRSRLPDLSSGFLQTRETLARPRRNHAAVLVAHDGNPQWRAVRRFVEHQCGLPTHELDSERAGPHAVARLSELLTRCSFAICLLSSRDVMADGRRRVAQEMVHQAGIFQGRYGFGRVAILAETGCDTFSNIAGLIRLEFDAQHVDGTFPELERMLQREGLLG